MALIRALLLLLLVAAGAHAWSVHSVPTIPSPITTTWESSGAHRWMQADNFILATPVALTADATAPGSSYVSKASTSAYNVGMAAACDPNLPNQTNYIWFNILDTSSTAKNLMWLSSSRLPRNLDNTTGFATNNNQATATWTWTRAANGVTFSNQTKTNNASPRTIATNGSGCIYFTFDVGVRVSYIFITSDANADPASIVGVDPISTDYTVLDNGTITINDADDLLTANLLSPMTGDGTASGVEIRMAWDKDATPRKIYWTCTYTDASVQATQSTADNLGIFSEDYCGLYLMNNQVRAFDENTIFIAANARQAGPSVLDANFPSGSQSNAYDANPVCSVDLPSGQWRIFCSADLPTAHAAGTVVLGNFEFGDKDAGSAATYRMWRGSTGTAADYGGILLSSSAMPESPGDVTPPTIGTATFTNVTSSALTATFTVNEAGTFKLQYGTATTVYTSETSLQNCSSSCVFNISGLAAGTTYYVRGTGSDTAGNSANGSESSQATSAAAAGIYIATNGSDSADCSSGTPCLTWAKVFPLLDPGETLYVKNGQYDTSVNGAPRVDCAAGGNANNGTQSQPITWKAENERQAYIRINSDVAVGLVNCSWWIVEGLRIEAEDVDSEEGKNNFNVHASHNNIIRRLLINRTNRYESSHGIRIRLGNNNLLEENEIYNYCRHGIIIEVGSGNEIRRNYINSRARSDAGLNCGQSNVQSNWGDVAIGLYPANDTILENNILENNYQGINVIGGSSGGHRNKSYGNICLNTSICFKSDFSTSGGALPLDNQWIDNVAYLTAIPGFQTIGFYMQAGSTGTQLISKSTAIGGNIGFAGRAEEGFPASTTVSYIRSSLATGAVLGFSASSSLDDWLHQYINGYNNTTNYSPSSHANLQNSTAVDPQLGACRIWLPDASPMKGAGFGGEDKGANVLKRYEGGTLLTGTANRLWHATTGAPLFAGAQISGVNDTAGASLFDIQDRLNINTGGCSFPTGY